jgi:hypothetical protein
MQYTARGGGQEGSQYMELLSAPQYNSIAQCSLVVVNQIVKECHAHAEPMFLTMFRTLQIPLFNIIHLKIHTLLKNLPFTSYKSNSKFYTAHVFTVCPL